MRLTDRARLERVDTLAMLQPGRIPTGETRLQRIPLNASALQGPVSGSTDDRSEPAVTVAA